MYSQIIRYNHLKALDAANPYKYRITGYDYLEEKNSFVLWTEQDIVLEGDWDLEHFWAPHLDWLPAFRLANGLYVERIEPQTPDSLWGQLWAAGVRAGDTIVDISVLPFSTLLATKHEFSIVQAWLAAFATHTSCEVRYLHLGQEKTLTLTRLQPYDLLTWQDNAEIEFACSMVLPPSEHRHGLCISRLNDALLPDGSVHVNPLRQAGLQVGDTIVTMGGLTVEQTEWSVFHGQLGQNGALPITYARDGQECTTTLHIQPVQDKDGNHFRIGLSWRQCDAKKLKQVPDISGVFAMGHLTVRGSIVNQWVTPYILVGGDLHAKNLLLSAANIEVAGKVTVEEALYFFSDGSSFYAHGGLDAGVYIRERAGETPTKGHRYGSVVSNLIPEQPIAQRWTFSQFFDLRLSDAFGWLEHPEETEGMSNEALRQYMVQELALQEEEDFEFSEDKLCAAILSGQYRG